MGDHGVKWVIMVCFCDHDTQLFAGQWWRSPCRTERLELSVHTMKIYARGVCMLEYVQPLCDLPQVQFYFKGIYPEHVPVLVRCSFTCALLTVERFESFVMHVPF